MEMHELTKKLLESYGTLGGLNHTEGLDLPSRKAVSRILADLKTLLFPGYHEESGLDSRTIKYTIAETANRAARGIVQETEKAIHWGCKEADCRKGPDGCREEADKITQAFFSILPDLRALLMKDIEAAFQGDPAAKSHDEVILAYPAVDAISVHRIAHFFWKAGVPLIPRLMSEQAHSSTGIDIHPGATIGESFFIDHGTGVVIGETTVIGKGVKLYQGVTLGALSVDKKEGERKRHPSIEDGVTVYAGATILGGDTVIGAGSVIGGNAWITESVPPGSLVHNPKGQLVVKSPEAKQASGISPSVRG